MNRQVSYCMIPYSDQSVFCLTKWKYRISDQKSLLFAFTNFFFQKSRHKLHRLQMCTLGHKRKGPC